jgi:hypothetical protein
VLASRICFSTWPKSERIIALPDADVKNDIETPVNRRPNTHVALFKSDSSVVITSDIALAPDMASSYQSNQTSRDSHEREPTWLCTLSDLTTLPAPKMRFFAAVP